MMDAMTGAAMVVSCVCNTCVQWHGAESEVVANSMPAPNADAVGKLAFERTLSMVLDDALLDWDDVAANADTVTTRGIVNGECKYQRTWDIAATRATNPPPLHH